LIKSLTLLGPVGTVIATSNSAAVWLVAQTTEFHLSVADAIAIGTAASTIPTLIGVALWRKWNQTDQDIKKYLERLVKMEGSIQPCQCERVREALKKRMDDFAMKMQASITNVEERLERHIDTKRG
jgi:hypothetical protein